MKRYEYFLYENGWWQWAIAGLCTIAIQVLRHNRYIDLTSYLNPNDPDSMVTLYSTLASIFGSLLGFIITAGAIVFSVLGSPNLSVVRKSAQAHLIGEIFFRTARSLGLATFLAFFLIVDRVRDLLGVAAPLAITLILILVLLRVVACLWLLEKVVRLVSKEP